MQVVTNDDVAVENSLYTTGRRGVAGTLVVEKIVGAAAEEGRRSRDAARRSATRVNAATRSMGVALTSCTVPAAGKPTFDIGDGEMEFGVGIHGEPGRRRDSAEKRRRDRRGNVRGHRRRSRRRRQGQRAAVRQRLRRHAADGALPDVQQRAEAARDSTASPSSARSSAPTSPRSTWPAARSRCRCSMTRQRGCGTRRCTPPRCAGGCAGAADGGRPVTPSRPIHATDTDRRRPAARRRGS